MNDSLEENIRRCRRLLELVTEDVERARAENLLPETEQKDNDPRVEQAFLARSRANDFTLRADECLQLAAKSQDHIIKQYYEEIARTYDALANAEEQRARRLENSKPRSAQIRAHE